MTPDAGLKAQCDVPSPEEHPEDGASKVRQFLLLRAVGFLVDLLDEPALALLALVGVMLFILVSGAVALAQEGFSSGGPPPGLGLGG